MTKREATTFQKIAVVTLMFGPPAAYMAGIYFPPNVEGAYTSMFLGIFLPFAYAQFLKMDEPDESESVEGPDA